MPTSNRLFDQYTASADQKLAASAELVERRLRRAYASAIDNLNLQAEESTEKLRNAELQFTNPDFTAIAAFSRDISRANEGVAALKVAFKAVFGEDPS